MKFLTASLVILVHSCILAQSDTTLTVYFQNDSAELSEVVSSKVVERVKELLENHDAVNAKVIGYCDDVGSDEYNQNLSLERALAVAELLSKNVELGVLEPTGKGEIPLYKSKLGAAAQRKENRRVDVILSPTSKNKEAEPVDEPPSYLEGELKVGEKIVLEGILFVGNQDQILVESVDNVAALLAELKAHPNVSVQIQGHIYDPYYYNPEVASPDTDNLSERRAKKIYNYLITNGIAPERLSYVGFEGKYPLNGDPKNDRRVEIEITGL